VARTEGRTGAYRVFVDRPDGNDRGVDPKDNIKMDPKNVGWGGIALTALDQDWGSRREIVNSVMNLLVP
jgi:hypothetical protein